jgi:hypothetical protein
VPIAYPGTQMDYPKVWREDFRSNRQALAAAFPALKAHQELQNSALPFQSK